MKIGLSKRKFSTFNFQFSMIVVLFLIASCGRSRRPGLSDQELFAQQATDDTRRQALMDEPSDFVLPDTNYVPPVGVK